MDFISSVIEGIQDKKGKKITILDLSKLDTAPAHTFVVCEGTNRMQTSAIADSIRDTVLDLSGRKPYFADGYRNSEWIILDYGDTVVHVFMPEIRVHYNLEELWNDAEFTEIPDLD